MKTFELEIMTLEKKIFLGKVKSLVVKADDGELCVLSGHAPLATILAGGEVRFRREDDQEEKVSGAGGFLTVAGDKAEVLLQA